MAKKIDYAGMYTIRPDGRYQGYYRDREGKRHTVCDRDPEALYRKIQEKESSVNAPLLFRDYAKAWLGSYGDRTVDSVNRSRIPMYNRAVARFGDWRIEDINAADINAHFMVMAKQGYARSTIQGQRTVYSLIFKYAIMIGDIKFNPAPYAVIPSSAKKPVKRRAPEDDTVHKIISSAQTAHFGMFAMFLVCTGFRRGEALAARWQDISDGWIHCTCQVQHLRGIVPPKSEAGIRKVPLLPALAAVLKMPEDAKPTDFIFHGNDPTKPMCQSSFDRKWKHYCKDMGFYTETQVVKMRKNGRRFTYAKYKLTLTPHVLRHLYATILYEAGIKLEAAMTYMGHSDVTITMAVYTDLRKGENEREAEKLIAHAETSLI